MARQVAPEMARNEPAHQVIGAAGRIADVEGDGLAGEVSVLGACRSYGHDREGGRERDGESVRHSGPLGGAVIRLRLGMVADWPTIENLLRAAT
jgi:hypothetical protein